MSDKRIPSKHVHAPKDKKGNVNMKVVWMICGAGIFFITAVFIFVCSIEYHAYKNIISAYKEGKYNTTEGYVENFIPGSYRDGEKESFDVNGVHFEYSDYENTQGYNVTRSHGGVIRKEGQYLKIGYIYDTGTCKNVIVRIEGDSNGMILYKQSE